MLHDFLAKHRHAILQRASELMLQGGLGPQEEVTRGIPIFYGQLVDTLEDGRGTEAKDKTRGEIRQAAGEQGETLHRLGFTVSQVVQGYGAVCHAITDVAKELNAEISAQDFQTMNTSLDSAIAGAVSQFESSRVQKSDQKEVEHLGELAHELRNTLTSAMVSFQMIQRGAVGIGGNTARLHEKSLARMKDLVDRSLTEVRIRSGSELHLEPVLLADLVDQIISVAAIDAQARRVTINVKFGPELRVEADPQLLLSALSNLTQNAIKYTRPGGTVELRASQSPEGVVIEIEDECGGMPADKARRFLTPFVRGSRDRGGLGLGMSIAYHAVLANGGQIRYRDLPGKGCVFGVSLREAGAETRSGSSSAA